MLRDVFFNAAHYFFFFRLVNRVIATILGLVISHTQAETDPSAGHVLETPSSTDTIRYGQTFIWTLGKEKRKGERKPRPRTPHRDRDRFNLFQMLASWTESFPHSLLDDTQSCRQAIVIIVLHTGTRQDDA